MPWFDGGRIQLGLDWRSTAVELGSSQYVTISPEFNPSEELILPKIVWRVAYTLGGLTTHSETRSFWPQQYVGRLFEIPPSPPDGAARQITAKLIKPRYLSKLDDAAALAKLEAIDLNIDKFE